MTMEITERGANLSIRIMELYEEYKDQGIKEEHFKGIVRQEMMEHGYTENELNQAMNLIAYYMLNCRE